MIRSGLRKMAVTMEAAQQRCCYHTIQAVPREYTGRRVAVRERSIGKIPSVVFKQSSEIVNGGRPISQKNLITTDRKQIRSILKFVKEPFFCSTTFQLQIRAGAGSSHLLDSGTVLPIKLHKDPSTGQILNLVFAWVDDDSEVTVEVPVVYKGQEECPGLKKGGSLKKISTNVKYICPGNNIPSKIEVDLSNLDIGDRIRIGDLEVHPSLKLFRSDDATAPVCKILASKC